VPDRVRIVWAGHLEKLLDVIGMLSRLVLEIVLNDSDVFLVRVIDLLVVVIIVVASNNHDSLGSHFGPLIPSVALLLAPLLTALGSAPRLPLGPTFPEPWAKMAPTASSPGVCRVAISSSSVSVFCTGKI
jgi:hypothetical protein